MPKFVDLNFHSCVPASLGRYGRLAKAESAASLQRIFLQYRSDATPTRELAPRSKRRIALSLTRPARWHV